ncbi:transposable element-related [Holotrichia oblita]|uniref:Transposable element-related n=1 Tax=Holotrichia oblita TaxID=644536 RepID=A0ACB9T1S2_HOLOL|nr:transposable element-related [Holotrichia oblita]
MLTRRPGSGRGRTTTARDDRFLVFSALRNRTVTAVSLRNHLREVRNVNISEWTVRRRLHPAGLSSRTRATGPPFSSEHRIARLNFAREYLAWTIADWTRVLFSDESRFCLTGSVRRVRVWRRQGERYAQTSASIWLHLWLEEELTKYTFATILSTVFEKYATENTIRNGFRKCGLFPFEKSNVDYTKCVSTRQVVDPTKLLDIQSTTISKKNILCELEKKIPPLELSHFRTNFENKDDWKGNLEFKKLYEVWAEFKNEVLLVENKHEHVTGEDNSNLIQANEEMSISFSVPTASTSSPNGEKIILPNEEQSQNDDSTILQNKSTSSLNVSELFPSPDKLESVVLYKDKEDQGYVVKKKPR